ncbi:MAG: two-component regulator propeller domain-containing protein [Rhodothermales bacterium]|nr:two-component regulator propeller domain-containing protein [Rhodothermales bacterium]
MPRCPLTLRDPAALLLWGVLLAVAWAGRPVQAHPGTPPSGPDPSHALTQYVLDAWTVEDGLPLNSVTAVLRGQDGFLWVGTQEGLARFDGLRFDLDYRDLPSSFVSALHETADGTLWVGTYGGLVAYADGAFGPVVEGLPGSRISALASDADGALWVGTYDGGLARIVDGAVETFTPADGMPEAAVMNLAVTPDGTVWIATLAAGLVRYDPASGARFTTFTAADGLPEAALTSLALDDEGTLWIGTEDGLARYAGGRFTTLTAADGLPITDLRSVLVDDFGAAWLGGSDGGLVRFHGGHFSTLTPEEGLPAGRVRALHLDDEGNVWVGTDSGGLGRLREGALVPYSTAEGLADPYVWSVYEDAAGALWVGTEGGLSRLVRGRFTTFTTADGLPNDRIISVRGTRDGAIWAGTHGDGLVRYAGGRFTTFTTADGLPSPSVYALYEDGEGTLWIGTGDGLARYADGQFTTFTTEDGLTSNLITVLAEDARGCLLVGTYEGGLNVLCDGAVTGRFTTAEGLPTDLVLSLHVDADGVIWAGLLGGLSRIEGDAVHAFTVDDGLYSDEILQLFEDASGVLWMTSNRGLFRVPRAVLDAAARGEDVAIEPVVYGRATGQHSPEFNGGVQPAGWHGQDGTMWFPTTEGLMAVRPADLPALSTPAPHLDAFLVDEEPVALAASVALPPGGRRFQFGFVAPSFVAPERLRYRYRLDGVDDDWVDAGDRREAFYTNVAPGAYTFRVQAIGPDGALSDVQTLTFDVAPHFYQTAWFVALCVLSVAALLYLLYLLRVRYLVARQRELEHLVEVRTEDLREANRQLSETSELKSQLMHMVAHDLKNPLNGVHEICKLLRMELDPDAPQQELVALAEEAAEQMLKMVLQFLDVEALESNKLNIDPEPIDLGAAALGAVRRYEMAAIKKGQTLLTEPIPRALPLVQADPLWINEVLDNLISNAVKFTPPGKRVWVEVQPADDHVRFSVRDEGPGLTPNDLNKLFGKFQRLTAQPTGGESSSGLGLSIVKRIVEMFDGRVWAENVPGGGSVFSVELPVAEPAPSDPRAGEPQERPAVRAPEPLWRVDRKAEPAPALELSGVFLEG